MTLSKSDANFLQQRRRLMYWWRYAGAMMAALIASLVAFLWWKSPLLINPFSVMDRIEADTLAESTLLVSAVILPMVTLSLMGVLVALVAFIYVAFANERKLIAIIDQLSPAPGKRSRPG